MEIPRALCEKIRTLSEYTTFDEKIQRYKEYYTHHSNWDLCYKLYESLPQEEYQNRENLRKLFDLSPMIYRYLPIELKQNPEIIRKVIQDDIGHFYQHLPIECRNDKTITLLYMQSAMLFVLPCSYNRLFKRKLYTDNEHYTPEEACPQFKYFGPLIMEEIKSNPDVRIFDILNEDEILKKLTID